MTDYRIKYLKFSESRPLLISIVATSILCTTSLIGLLLENGKRCQPDMQLWLIVVIIRSAVRLFCRLFVAYTTLREDNVVDQIHTGSKFVDILDVFGVVWFAVGNLLVFNNFACVRVSPIVFFSGLSYICGSYIHFFLPSVLRLTFTCFSPTHIDDIAYLRQTADADREVGMVHLRTTLGGNGLGAANNSSAYSSELTPERARYWMNWLESYGCLAVSYHPSMMLKEKEVSRDVDKAEHVSHTSTDNYNNNSNSSKKYVVLNQTEGAEEVDLELGMTNSSHSSNNRHTNAYVNVSASSAIDDETDKPAAHPNNSRSSNKSDINNVHSNANDTVAGNLEIDFCSICLNPFEYSSDVVSGSNSGTLPNTGDVCDAPTSYVNGGTMNSNAVSPATVQNVAEENNNVIVRYPCGGHHYFHAHCLHSWLQVSFTRCTKPTHLCFYFTLHYNTVTLFFLT